MPPSQQERTRILVVDDEPAIVEVLCLVLEKQGYQTASAANGPLAVEAARSFRPQCVICDVHLPGMNGVDAVMRITEILPACKVLLISGYTAVTETLREARAKGHDFPLLIKPMYPTELLRAVAAQLASQ